MKRSRIAQGTVTLTECKS